MKRDRLLSSGHAGRGAQSGFALIVAILALLLLTFLGLTLATTTSTELQIAANYRWGQQAFYNAEAGLEIARKLLREQTVWQIFLPQPRDPASMGAAPVWTATGRDFENQECDVAAVVGTAGAGYQGYGVILNLVGYTRLENVSTFLGQTINGSFTVWVRRPTTVDQTTGQIADSTADDNLIVTVEGTAPFVGAAANTNYAIRTRAVRILETEVQKIDPNDCENRGGQAGSSPLGSGYDPCYNVNPEGLPTPTGTQATEVEPNQ